LRYAGGAHGVPASKQAAAGVDGQFSADRGVSVFSPFSALTEGDDAKTLQAHDLGDGKAVMHVDDVDVFGPYPVMFHARWPARRDTSSSLMLVSVVIGVPLTRAQPASRGRP
jgi:hypothetical protein